MGMEMEMDKEKEMETDPDLNPNPSPSPSPDNSTKACADCHTTKTPLWRGGPEGPKSLCNACGIRYRKRRRQALGLDAADAQQDHHQRKNKAADPHEDQQQPKRKAAAAASSTTTTKKDKDRKRKDRPVTVELRVVGFGKEAVLKQRRQMRRDKCLSRLSEEEMAAVHLMALSSGVIYAS